MAPGGRAAAAMKLFRPHARSLRLPNRGCPQAWWLVWGCKDCTAMGNRKPQWLLQFGGRSCCPGLCSSAWTAASAGRGSFHTQAQPRMWQPGLPEEAYKSRHGQDGVKGEGGAGGQATPWGCWPRCGTETSGRARSPAAAWQPHRWLWGPGAAPWTPAHAWSEAGESDPWPEPGHGGKPVRRQMDIAGAEQCWRSQQPEMNLLSCHLISYRSVISVWAPRSKNGNCRCFLLGFYLPFPVQTNGSSCCLMLHLQAHSHPLLWRVPH